MILLVIVSVLAVSNGLPQLYSNAGSQLSGEYCPVNIKITCNALGFGTDGTLAWYVGDTILAQYQNLRTNNKFPQDVMVDSSVLNATVQISSSNISNNLYNFENFILTAQLNDLLSIQGQNITCGTFLERSNVFSVNNFSILEVVHKVFYLAKYRGVNGELTEIDVQWIDKFDSGKCGIITFYVVQLLNYEREISRQILSTENCTSSQCSVQFKSPDLSIERYEIKVTASNQWLNNSFSSFNIIRNTTGNLISINKCNNTASITCSTSVNKNCSVNSTDSASVAIIKPGDISSFETIPEVINIIIHIHSTTLKQTFTHSVDNINAIVISGLIISIIGFIFLIAVCVLGVINCYMSQTKINGGCCLISIISFSIIAAILTLVLVLIHVGIFHPDSCLDTSRSQHPVLIAALALSIIIVITSILLGVILVVIIPKSLQKRNKYKLQFAYCEVKFGTERNLSGVQNGQECTICKGPYYRYKKNGEGIVVFSEKIRNESFCKTCCKSMCENCFKEAYLKFCKHEENICNKCYEEYQKEIREIPNLQQFGKIRPIKPNYSKICWECKHGEQEDPCRRRGKGFKVKKNSSCPTCGQWMCDDCFHDNEVDITYLKKKKKICKNCYAIYKMTADDVNKESTL